jgi:hypothetical protein
MIFWSTMKNRIIALVVGMILLLCSTILAQATDTLWTRTYGGTNGDHGYCVQQTSDGGYIITGWTASFGNGGHDVYLIKTDAQGDTAWTKTFGGTLNDRAYSCQQTFDGGYVVVGYTWSFGAGDEDVYLIRTDSLGIELWAKTFEALGRDHGWSVQQTSDSGYVIAGSTSPSGPEPTDVYLIKTDPSGDTVWTRTFGGSSLDEGLAVQQTVDDGYIIAGWTMSFGMSGQVYLIKTGPQGDTTWTKTYGGADGEFGYSVQQTSDHGYIVAGSKTTASSGTDAYIVKTDSLGNEMWIKSYGSNDNDEAYCIRETFDNGYIAVGNTGPLAHDDIWLIKGNGNGDTTWTRKFGGDSVELGFSVEQTSDSGYIIVGDTYSYGMGGSDVWLIKLDKDAGISEEPIQIHSAVTVRSKIFPNPFTTATRLEIQGINKDAQSNLTIHDATGRLVKSVTLATSTYELGADLKAGIYFLKLNGKPVGKVVKVR